MSAIRGKVDNMLHNHRSGTRPRNKSWLEKKKAKRDSVHLSCSIISTCIMNKINKAVHLSVCRLVRDVMTSNRSIGKRAILKKICSSEKTHIPTLC